MADQRRGRGGPGRDPHSCAWGELTAAVAAAAGARLVSVTVRLRCGTAGTLPVRKS